MLLLDVSCYIVKAFPDVAGVNVQGYDFPVFSAKQCRQLGQLSVNVLQRE